MILQRLFTTTEEKDKKNKVLVAALGTAAGATGIGLGLDYLNEFANSKLADKQKEELIKKYYENRTLSEEDKDIIKKLLDNSSLKNIKYNLENDGEKFHNSSYVPKFELKGFDKLTNEEKKLIKDSFDTSTPETFIFNKNSSPAIISHEIGHQSLNRDESKSIAHKLGKLAQKINFKKKVLDTIIDESDDEANVDIWGKRAMARRLVGTSLGAAAVHKNEKTGKVELDKKALASGLALQAVPRLIGPAAEVSASLHGIRNLKKNGASKELLKAAGKELKQHLKSYLRNEGHLMTQSTAYTGLGAGAKAIAINLKNKYPNEVSKKLEEVKYGDNYVSREDKERLENEGIDPETLKKTRLISAAGTIIPASITIPSLIDSMQNKFASINSNFTKEAIKRKIKDGVISEEAGKAANKIRLEANKDLIKHGLLTGTALTGGLMIAKAINNKLNKKAKEKNKEKE